VDERFKTLRHIETVRNHLNACVRELLARAELHDQSKLQDPERAMFDEYTPLLRASTYGSEEYQGFLKGMSAALAHHYEKNRHHPEHFQNGVQGMTLIDALEMLCDWKSSTLRHADGDIFKSIEINQKRFGYSDELKRLLVNTAEWLNSQGVFHHAEES
jgi:uncharacterized protein DUF5662